MLIKELELAAMESVCSNSCRTFWNGWKVSFGGGYGVARLKIDMRESGSEGEKGWKKANVDFEVYHLVRCGQCVYLCGILFNAVAGDVLLFGWSLSEQSTPSLYITKFPPGPIGTTMSPNHIRAPQSRWYPWSLQK
jgi:hypothetical protein